jgi:hypothetical protein
MIDSYSNMHFLHVMKKLAFFSLFIFTRTRIYTDEHRYENPGNLSATIVLKVEWIRLIISFLDPDGIE